MPEELSYITRGHDSWYWTLETPAPLEALCTSEEMHTYLALLEQLDALNLRTELKVGVVVRSPAADDLI